MLLPSARTLMGCFTAADDQTLAEASTGTAGAGEK